ncbi:MAG: nucleotide exchange factor GrpE [Candidatus Anstonellaceae archaeon]
MSTQNKNSNVEKSEENQEGNIKKELAECEEYKKDLQRLAAEFDNYKKRTQKELQLAYQKGQEDVLSNLLDIYEEILISLNHNNQNADPQTIQRGLELLQKKLDNFFSSYKIKEIDCSGEPDPHLHEVILAVEGEPDGKIAQVIKRGYTIGDKLLRAAKVSIYKKPKQKENKNKENEKVEPNIQNTQNKVDSSNN